MAGHDIEIGSERSPGLAHPIGETVAVLERLKIAWLPHFPYEHTDRFRSTRITLFPDSTSTLRYSLPRAKPN